MLEYDKLYTVEDVAQKTGLTDRTIRNYLKDGRLKGKKIGGQWRFTADDIEALFRTPGEEVEKKSGEMDDFLAFSCDSSNPDVCVMVDYCCEESAAKEIAVRIYAEKDDPANNFSKGRITFEYEREAGKAHYIVRGNADFAAAMLKIIRKQTKKI